MKQITVGKSVITPRDTNSLNLYLKEVSHQKLISPQEEIELAKKIQQGDRAALDKLVLANTRFVITVAKQYQGLGLPLEDLIAEGNTGLIKAAEKFDPSKDVKFISYAVWWIKQSILKAIYYTADNVRLPTSQIEPISKLSKIISKFEKETGRKPTDEELSELSGLSEDRIKSALSVSNKCISIDAPSIDDSEDCTIGDCIENTNSENPLEETNHSIISDRIGQLLDKLNNRDHDIICMNFGLKGCNEMSYEEIARKFALSSERIRQIVQGHLKQFKENKEFKALL